MTGINSFLTNRSQTLIVNGAYSTPSKVISGVSKGSVLGPLIFIILLGDIDTNITYSTLRSFADDTRISKGIRNTEDGSKLQYDLNAVYTWAGNNNMKFNDGKFELIRYGFDVVLKSTINYLSTNNTQFKEKLFLKDMTNDGSFTHHIQHMVELIRQQSRWVLRVFQSRTPHVCVFYGNL